VTERTPPKLATKLLEYGSSDVSITGDLREAYTNRRSDGWYWRQVIAIILTRNYAVVIARGLGTGWLTLWAFKFTTAGLSNHFANWSLDWLIANLGSHPFVMLWAVVLSGRPFQIAGYVVSGWMVARLHRRFRGMAVFWFMTTVLVRSAWDTANWFVNQSRVYDQIAFPVWMAASAALPLFIFLGGRLSDAPIRSRGLA